MEGSGSRVQILLFGSIHGEGKDKVRPSWYTVLYDMIDPFISSEMMQRAALRPEDFLGMKVNDLYAFVISTFSGESKLKLESEQELLNGLLNPGVKAVSIHKREKGV